MNMEIKIPREVRDYQEGIFMGLTVRQVTCSIIAIIVAVIAYFLSVPISASSSADTSQEYVPTDERLIIDEEQVIETENTEDTKVTESPFDAKNALSKELAGWICIIVALPIGLIGFVKYNGMPFEHFAITWIKSEILTPKQLYFKANNFMYQTYDLKLHLEPKLTNKPKLTFSQQYKMLIKDIKKWLAERKEKLKVERKKKKALKENIRKIKKQYKDSN